MYLVSRKRNASIPTVFPYLLWVSYHSAYPMAIENNVIPRKYEYSKVVSALSGNCCLYASHLGQIS